VEEQGLERKGRGKGKRKEMEKGCEMGWKERHRMYPLDKILDTPSYRV